MAFNTGTVPLIQALPSWFDTDDSSCIVVTDSVETDGRFFLHTLASETLSNNNNNNDDVLWLACGPLTEHLVATAMRKMGCDAAASYVKSTSSNDSTGEWNRPLAIYSILSHLSKQENTDDFNEEDYLKSLYRRIQEYRNEKKSRTTIIVDDVSSLASIFGERLVYFFLRYLRNLSNCHLVVRCSNDTDRELYQHEEGKVDWVGAGGKQQSHNDVPWERQLVELADWVVDVVPLASGYSREAHGRLVVTKTSATQPLVMNYCLQDTSVSAIRLNVV